jgi:hypothetical protein
MAESVHEIVPPLWAEAELGSVAVLLPSRAHPPQEPRAEEVPRDEIEPPAGRRLPATTAARIVADDSAACPAASARFHRSQRASSQPAQPSGLRLSHQFGRALGPGRGRASGCAFRHLNGRLASRMGWDKHI